MINVTNYVIRYFVALFEFHYEVTAQLQIYTCYAGFFLQFTLCGIV